ncbi:MAG TPA: hypothetical protein VIV11_23855 [Kofleriaceae bacterium]
MRLALITPLVLAGCFTDPTGETCVWVPGGDGHCPGDSEGGGSGPQFHRYYGAAARGVGDQIRVVMTGRDDSADPIVETTTLYAGEQPVPPSPILDGTKPLVGEFPQLSVVGDQAFMVWQTRDQSTATYQHGAPLLADGSLGTRHDFGGVNATLRRVGNRHFIRSSRSNEILGTWLRADGELDATTDLWAELQPTDIQAETGDADALYAMAFYNEARTELRIGRVAADGTVLDGLGGLLVATAPPSFAFDDVALVATASAELLVIYGVHDRDYHRDFHAVRVAGTTVTDRLTTDFDGIPMLVVNGDRILALSRMPTSQEHFEARVLDTSGTVLSGPVYAGKRPNGNTHPIALGDAFALVAPIEHISITTLAANGAAGIHTIVASNYELENAGGCNAAGTSSPWLLLLALGAITRSRARAR